MAMNIIPSTAPAQTSAPAPTSTRASATLGEVHAHGHTFTFRRVDYLEQDDSDFASYRLDVDPEIGEVAVERLGLTGEGPWGIDAYQRSAVESRGMTAQQVRVWIAALAAAADLADRFNRDGADS